MKKMKANKIIFKINKSNKLENLVSEIQRVVLLKKNSCYEYNCDISKLCDLGVISFVECNMSNSIEISIKENSTNNKLLRKKLGIYFLLFLHNNKFKIRDLISIDYFENNNVKKVAKTWRDIKESRELKYKI